MFAAGSDNAEAAKVLRVHVRWVQRWRREWAERGEAGLVSKGPASLPELSDGLFVKLGAALAWGRWRTAGLTSAGRSRGSGR